MVESIFLKRLNSFTLAEVLITLGIIGVVAGMTIPILIQNTQNAEFKAGWKKDYSVLANATQQIMQDYGTLSPVITGADDTMRVLYEPYFKLAKPCPEPNVKGICWHNDNTWFLLNNSPIPSTVTGFGSSLLDNGPAGDILADGTLIRYLTYDCSASTYCGYILVDVNGFKKPNTVGKDIFGAHLYNNKLIPFGSSSSTKGEGTTCNPSTDNGFACSVVYLYQ